MKDFGKNSIFPLTNMYENEKNLKNMVYLRQPVNRVFREYTWGEVMDKARRIATFLMAQGFRSGDRIAILSKNCAEWIITDFGIILAGMITIPLYATQYKKDIHYILSHSGARALFIGKLDNYGEQKEGIPEGILRIDFPYDRRSESRFNLEDIFIKYEPMQGEPLPNLTDTFTIMYTSGTTGEPKGVVLTYESEKNIASFATNDIKKLLNLQPHEHFISYLPLAHAAERSIVELNSILFQSDVSFVESVDTFAEDLRNIAPTLFFAVPLVWMKFQMKILEKISEDTLKKLLKIPGISWFVRKKIKKSLGLHRSHGNFSGAAPLPRSTIEWFAKLGIDIFEGYGSTENSTYATMNTPKEYRTGSVGKPRPGVSVKVDGNGELLVRSPGNMAGYYKDTELTSQVLDKEGFVHTGDLGHIDEDGFIFILGRLKEQFKSAKGEFIVPVPIENKFAANSDIEQCCLIGQGLSQPILLAQLSEAAHKKSRSEVERDLLATLEEVDESLNNNEKVSHIYIVTDLWTPENNLLTPTQKIKRHAIAEKYGHAVNDLQKEKKKIAWEG